jgi:hypothetical protein
VSKPHLFISRTRYFCGVLSGADAKSIGTIGFLLEGVGGVAGIVALGKLKALRLRWRSWWNEKRQRGETCVVGLSCWRCS